MTGQKRRLGVDGRPGRLGLGDLWITTPEVTSSGSGDGENRPWTKGYMNVIIIQKGIRLDDRIAPPFGGGGGGHAFRDVDNGKRSRQSLRFIHILEQDFVYITGLLVWKTV